MPENETKAFVSIGFLCQQTQRPYFELLKMLHEMNVKPVYLLDLVPYYDWNEASRALEGKPLPMIQGAANHAE